MMELIKLAALGIVCFRLSQLVVYDNWPFNVMKSIRTFFGRKASSGNSLYLTIAELLTCPYCIGIWIAAVLALLVPFTNVVLYVINIFVIAGIQSFMEGIIGRQN
jgi:hypothetical protein